MSGLTDEAAIETHDLIERAETEERALHHDEDESNAGQPRVTPQKSAPDNDLKNAGGMSGAREEKSKLDNLKQALHLKK